MCGIAGSVHFDGKAGCSSSIWRANQMLRHRGPNQQGIFESSNASVGAVRLKIIDLECGDQPMRTEDGDCTLAFNGEIYNHLELRRELENLGHRFRSRCDTEVVLRAFAQWDTDCFGRFRGMFAAAFWQESQRRLVLARDRVGIKPLYYSVHNGNLYFGSELKAIFEHPEIPRRLSEEALSYFLALNYVPTPWTLVDGIKKLEPGSWLECLQGKRRKEYYWRNRFSPKAIGMEEACEELDSLLQSSIAEHLVSDVPLGIWVSGGLDSATILHYAAQSSPGPLDTFSISFPGKRFDESRHFRLLRDHYGTRHHEMDLCGDLDLTGAIHEISYYSDEPSADAGALPVWFLSRMTARYVRVALSGAGADETFGGYHTYLADRYAQRARYLPAPLLHLAAKTAALLPVSDQKIGFEYKLKRFLAGTLLPADEAHFYWNGAFSTSEQRALGGYHQPLSMASLYDALPDAPADVINRYLYVDQHYYLPDDILYKCDRMSMAHALEVRPPFLDHRLVEFAARLPSRLKISDGQTKCVLRKLMRKKIPAAILDRPKEGLDIPAHEWLRGPLRPLLLDALSSHSVRRARIFDPHAITTLVNRHLKREANLGYHLWGLLTLHLWVRRWRIEVPEINCSQLKAPDICKRQGHRHHDQRS